MPKSKIRVKGSKRRGPTLGRRGTVSVTEGEAFDQFLRRVFGLCAHENCPNLASRWPMTIMFEKQRTVFYPACELHEEEMQAKSCGKKCADHDHSTRVNNSEDWVVEQIKETMTRKYGLGVLIRGTDQLLCIDPRRK